MRLQLSPHPDLPGNAVSQVACDVSLRGDDLTFGYVATGRIADLAVAPISTSERADDLWRHTCFEAFVRPEGGQGYVELNFAPSTQWAAYRFTDYREGMATAELGAPRIEVASEVGRLAVSVSLSRSSLPPGPCRLALSAVIEERDGARSYWALAHPPGRPDFHHDAGFASLLPDMEPS
jgi:hypothetical protein